MQVKAEIKDFQLHDFLKDSKIAKVPLLATINGELNCKGSYEKRLDIQCPGELSLTDIKVKNARENRDIISAENIQVNGSANISENVITYRANAKMNDAQGESSGSIDFKKGFKIQYDCKDLNLSDFGEIAGLRIRGKSQCKNGKIHGDSRHATFSMEMDTDNFRLQDYFFGKIKNQLSYKKGVLSVKELSGKINSHSF